MSKTAVGLTLAVAASVVLNAAFLVQHAGSAALPAVDVRRPVGTLRSLLGSRRWLAGAALGLAGWALHVDALSHAPVSLVQAFVAGGIVLAIPMARLGLGHRIAPAERAAIAGMVAALVLLAVGLRTRHGHHFDGAGLAVACAVAGGAAAGLAALVTGARRAPALGLAAGLMYGVADLAIKAVTDVGHRGASHAAGSGWLPVAALATVGAFFAFQRALQSRRPIAVIALMTAGTNVVAILGGLAVFGDPLGHTPGIVALHVAAFALVAVSAWGLAPAQAALVTESA